MNPGRMKERITVQQAVKEANRSGGYKIVAWEDVKTIWAYVKNFDPERDKIASIDTRKALYDVWVRAADISTENRLLWRNRVLEIDFVEEYLAGPPFYLILKCKEARSL